MGLCTRCGRQADGGAEFCAGCGGDPVSALADQPPAASAMTPRAGYLRPFAADDVGRPHSPGPAGEPAIWAEGSSGPGRPGRPHDRPATSPSGQLPDMLPPASQPAGDQPPYFAPNTGAEGSTWQGSYQPVAWPAQQQIGAEPGLEAIPRQRSVQHQLPAPGPDAPFVRPAQQGGPAAPQRPALPAQAADRAAPQRLARSARQADPATPQRLARPAQRRAAAGSGPESLPYTAPALHDLPGSGQSPGISAPAAGRGSRRRPRAQPRAGDRLESSPYLPARPAAHGRWVSIAAAAVVLTMAAATVTILLADRGTPGGRAGTGKPAAPSPPGQRGAASAPPVDASSLIAVAPAAASATDRPAVVNFLTRYFTAINDHNYPAYRRLFSPALRGGLSASSFATGYATTQDSRATLQAIATAGSGQLAAAVSFVSHQRPANSPTYSACTAWSISLYLVRQRGQLVIETPPAGYAATSHSCS
jgi:hypothetical protein